MKTVSLSRDKTTLGVPIRIPELVWVIVRSKSRGKTRIKTRIKIAERVEELEPVGEKEVDGDVEEVLAVVRETAVADDPDMGRQTLYKNLNVWLIPIKINYKNLEES